MRDDVMITALLRPEVQVRHRKGLWICEQVHPTGGAGEGPAGLCRARLIVMLLLRRGHTPLETCCAHSAWFGWLGALSIRMLLRQDGRTELERRTEKKVQSEASQCRKKKKKKVTVQIYLTPGWMRVRHFPGFTCLLAKVTVAWRLACSSAWVARALIEGKIRQPACSPDFFPFWGE